MESGREKYPVGHAKNVVCAQIRSCCYSNWFLNDKYNSTTVLSHIFFDHTMAANEYLENESLIETYVFI